MNEEKKQPVGLWLRVSTGKQDETSQIPDCMAWVKSHDYKLVVGATYQVHGASARKSSKKFNEAWQQVLDDFKSGKIRVLVVWSLDRLDRKLQAFQMLQQVVDAGGRVEFVTQPHLNDLTNMGSRIALKVQEEIAFGESQIKSGRTRINQSGKIAKGSVVGVAGWGLKIAPGVNDAGESIKTLVPTTDGLKWAPVIFEMVAANESLATVALHLTGHDVKTKTGKSEWSPKTVGQIIRNHSMMGRRVDANGDTILKFTPLVPIDLWNQANAVLSIKSSRGPTRIENKSMLSGVMHCPCGSPMYLVNPQYSKKGPSYRCAGRGPVRKSACKNMISVAYADAKVNKKMLNNHTMIMKLGPAEGGDLKLALEDVMSALKQLPNQGYDDVKEDAEKANLREQRDKLTAEIEDAKFAPPKLVSTKVTHAQMWASLDGDNAGKNHWLKNAGAKVTGMGSTTDGKVKVTCELKLASLIWEEGYDGQAEQVTEIPPVVDGNWVFIAPGFNRRMRRAVPR